jgi:hypothetical protein
MKLNHRLTTLAVLLGSCIPAYAVNPTTIDGTFTGTVYAVGITNGTPANFSGLVGSSVTGSFSYDAQSLIFSSGSATSSTWITIDSIDPVSMSLTVGGQTYAVLATQQSNLVLDADESGASNPDNQFNLYGIGALSNPASGAPNASLDIVLANNNPSEPYISTINDPGTVSFTNQGLAAQSGQVSSFTLISSTNAGIGSIEFAITSATAGPVASVPEPSTYALMMAGLSVVGFAACRRKA